MHHSGYDLRHADTIAAALHRSAHPKVLHETDVKTSEAFVQQRAFVDGEPVAGGVDALDGNGRSRVADRRQLALGRLSVADCALPNSGRQMTGPAKAMADMIARTARCMPDLSSRHVLLARRSCHDVLLGVKRAVFVTLVAAREKYFQL